jgi:hypothetical protein
LGENDRVHDQEHRHQDGRDQRPGQRLDARRANASVNDLPIRKGIGIPSSVARTDG